MTQHRNEFSLSTNIDSVIAGLAGAFIILAFTRHGGIGISPDSVSYLSASRSITEGRGFLEYNGLPLVDFPMFYPIFLSILNLFIHLDPLAFSPGVNAVLFALLVYFSGAIMNGFKATSRWYKGLLLSFIVLSPTLLEVYSMLWSETLFLLLVIVFFIRLRIYLRSPNATQLLWVALVVDLAFLTRYAGITLLATGGFLILAKRQIPIRKRFAHCIGFSLVSSSLLVTNVLRNRMISGTLTGHRQRGVSTFLQNLNNFGSVLTDWLPIPKDLSWLFLATAIGCLLLSGLLFYLLLKKRIQDQGYELISAVFALIYCLFMLLTATLSRYELFTSRLLSPAFIPLLWNLTSWFTRKLPLVGGLPKVALITLGLLFCVGWQYNQLTQDYETYDGVKDAGIPGYTEDPFPSSPIVQFIQKDTKDFKPTYRIFSNAGDAFYFFTKRPAFLLPQKVFPAEVNQFYQDSGQYVIWFDDIDNPDVVDLASILAHKKLHLLKRVSNGAVYETVD